MVKRKQFSIVWAVVGFFLCLLPLLVYLLVYATSSDQMVVIRLVGAAAPNGPVLSDDGRYWWDGTRWLPVPATPVTPPALGQQSPMPSLPPHENPMHSLPPHESPMPPPLPPHDDPRAAGP